MPRLVQRLSRHQGVGAPIVVDGKTRRKEVSLLVVQRSNHSVATLNGCLAHIGYKANAQQISLPSRVPVLVVESGKLGRCHIETNICRLLVVTYFLLPLVRNEPLKDPLRVSDVGDAVGVARCLLITSPVERQPVCHYRGETLKDEGRLERLYLSDKRPGYGLLELELFGWRHPVRIAVEGA